MMARQKRQRCKLQIEPVLDFGIYDCSDQSLVGLLLVRGDEENGKILRLAGRKKPDEMG
jgi:hypothetical protein